MPMVLYTGEMPGCKALEQQLCEWSSHADGPAVPPEANACFTPNESMKAWCTGHHLDSGSGLS